MDTPEFVHYIKTTNKRNIDELISLAKENNIQYEVENYPEHYYVTYNVDINKLEYIFKIQQQDFLKLEKLELENSELLINNISNDYYLYHFSDIELKEVIQKSDEWSKLDFLLAQKILSSRGITIHENEIEEIKNQRITDLSEPENNQSIWVIFGYILAFLGGILGVIIGYHLVTHKRTLPNGERIFDYHEKDRKNGKIIFVIGTIVLLIKVISFFIQLNNE